MPQENCVFNSSDGLRIFEETQFDVAPRITKNKSVGLLKKFFFIEDKKKAPQSINRRTNSLKVWINFSTNLCTVPSCVQIE